MFDIRTLGTVALINGLAMLAAIVVLWRTVPAERSLKHWALGLALVILAPMLTALKGVAPDVAVYAVSPTVLVLGVSYLLSASMTLLHREGSMRWTQGITLGVFLGCLYFTVVMPSFSIRSAIFALALVPIFSACAWQFARHGDSSLTWANRLIGAVFAVAAILYLLRGTLALTNPETTQADQTDSLIRVLPYFFGIGFSIAIVAVVALYTIVRLQERYRAERDKAEAANAAKTLFLSSMSHEIRTPMNAVLGFTQLLEMGDALSAEQQDAVKEIRKAGGHLLELVNDLLDLSRIEAGKLSVALEKIDIQQIVDECVDLVALQAAEKGITVNRELKSHEQALADHLRLRQVLLNLLTNAIKYNTPGGRVDICLDTARDQRLRIRVRDTGPGIPEEKRKQLFQPFNRLGAEMGTIQGTGIGLVISKRLMEMMGGAIGVSPPSDVGTEFWLEIPAATN